MCGHKRGPFARSTTAACLWTSRTARCRGPWCSRTAVRSKSSPSSWSRNPCQNACSTIGTSRETTAPPTRRSLPRSQTRPRRWWSSSCMRRLRCDSTNSSCPWTTSSASATGRPGNCASGRRSWWCTRAARGRSTRTAAASATPPPSRRRSRSSCRAADGSRSPCCGNTTSSGQASTPSLSAPPCMCTPPTSWPFRTAFRTASSSSWRFVVMSGSWSWSWK